MDRAGYMNWLRNTDMDLYAFRQRLLQGNPLVIYTENDQLQSYRMLKRQGKGDHGPSPRVERDHI